MEQLHQQDITHQLVSLKLHNNNISNAYIFFFLTQYVEPAAEGMTSSHPTSLYNILKASNSPTSSI